MKLFIGLYHGSEVLGDVQTTSELPVSCGNCEVNQKVTFDLHVSDVQLASRLCFTLHGRMKGSKVSMGSEKQIRHVTDDTFLLFCCRNCHNIGF